MGPTAESPRSDPRNPFGADDAEPPLVFAGRQEALSAVESLWRRSTASGPVEPVFVFGTAGTGKSALLAELAARADDAQWSSGVASVEPGASGPQRVLGGLAAAVRGLYRRRPGAPGMQRMRDRAEAAAVGDPSRLGDTMVELGDDALDVGRGLVVLADDLHHAHDVDAVAEASARVAARGLPVAVIAACAPPGWMDEHRVLPMRPLTTAEITDLLQGAAATRGGSFADAAVAAIEELSGGCPRLVRAYGRHAWDVTPGSVVDVAAVEAGRPAAEARLAATFYGPRLAGLSGPERRFLQALAAFGGTDVPLESVARKLGDVNRFQPEQSQTARVRDALIDAGLVYTPDGERLYSGLPELARFLA
jgi:hypothetical protein